MQRAGFPLRLLAVVAALAAAPLALTQPPPDKVPPPDRETQARTEALIKRLFAADYEEARKGGESARSLAGILLREARATRDDPVLRFGALCQARDLAAEAGDAITVLQAIEDLAKHYTINTLPMKRAALIQAARKASGKEANEAAVEAALAAIDDALAEDDYEAAKQLIEAAELAGVRVRNLALYGRIDRRAREVEAARAEFGAMKQFADRLARDPNDPEANLEMGKYTCLIKGNWERGVAMLLKSNDAAWKALAEKERAAPKEPKLQVELGDEHGRLAEREKGQAKRNLQRRALHWYEQALPKLEGLTKLRVAREVKDLAAQFPSLLARAEITGEIRKIEAAHAGGVAAVAISPDGKRILSAGQNDKLVKLWDAESGKKLRDLTGHSGNLMCVAFSRDGKLGASGCTNNQLKLWDLDKGTELRQLPGHNDYVRAVVFLPDRTTLLSASDDKTVRHWDVASGKLLKTMTGHGNYINALSIDKEGKLAATGSTDMTARVWDVAKGAEVKRYAHEANVGAVALAPDGKSLVTSTFDQKVRVWDVDSGKEVRRLPHPSTAWALAFAPDGKQLLSGSGAAPGGKPALDPKGKPAGPDNFLRVWDMETGKEVRKLAGHTQALRSVAYSEDGRFAVTCANDNTIRLWGQK